MRSDDPAQVLSVIPHFIVQNHRASVEFYREQLGFELVLEVPEDEPFFAIVQRGGASIALKEIASDVLPIPNCSRHEYARWDAFLHTLNPDLLYEEYRAQGVTVHRPIADTEDGLRAFEIRDLNGYVLCFGRPLESA